MGSAPVKKCLSQVSEDLSESFAAERHLSAKILTFYPTKPYIVDDEEDFDVENEDDDEKKYLVPQQVQH